VVSYVLQGIGQAIEGNDMGEVVLIKKLFGKPYVAIAPRPESANTQNHEVHDQSSRR